MTIHVGIDESGTSRMGRNTDIYSMSAVIFEDETEYDAACDYVIENNKKIKTDEIKYSKSTNPQKNNFFKNINKYKHKVISVEKVIKEDNNEEIYIDGLLGLNSMIAEKYSGKIIIKIDNIYSKKKQLKIRNMLSNIYRQRGIEVHIQFAKSHANPIIQIADMYAGKNRKEKQKVL